MVALLARYLLNDLGDLLHALHRPGAAQLDRPLVVLSCAAAARGHASSGDVHFPKHADGIGIILSRGPLEPWQRLLVVHIDTDALVVHAPELILAPSVTRLSTDLVRCHRPRDVDCHALTPEEVANGRRCSDVALVWSGVV